MKKRKNEMKAEGNPNEKLAEVLNEAAANPDAQGGEEKHPEAPGEGEEEHPGPPEEPADSRTARLEQLFKGYPLTLALLKESKGIEIGERILTFLAGVDGYARGSGLPKGEIDAALQMLFTIVRGYQEGTLDLGTLETILKGMGYDRRLEEERAAASGNGRRRGLASREPAKDSDGVPNLRGRSVRGDRGSLGIFSLAASAK